MTDPYSVLGISRNASADDIKKAYRQLSRKYHPDANINNPNKAQAEEKFKQIQEAYNQIMDEREHGGSSYGGNYHSGYSSGYGYGSSAAQDNINPRINAAINYINSGHYREAMNTLESIPQNERNATWYFVRANAHYRMGNIINATEDARTANYMEPGNTQFAMFLSQLENGGNWYSNMGNTYTTSTSGTSNCCARLLCFEMLCNCCCLGGL